MKTIARRLERLEERVGALPIVWGVQPMTLAEFISLYPDLISVLGHLADRFTGQPPEIQAWGRHKVTPENCQQLIDAVAAEDEKARGGTRPIPSRGLMGDMAREARKFIDEALREHPPAPQGVLA